MFIEDVEYRWKTKGTRSKVVVGWLTTSLDVDKELNWTCCSDQLATKDNKTVAESHSKRRSGLFKKARDMSLEISGVVSLAVDVILLTFILSWRERKSGVVETTFNSDDALLRENSESYLMQLCTGYLLR